MSELKIGMKGSAQVEVVPANTAAAMGSGALDVFATPSMIALMEKAALELVGPCLEEGQGTVGIELNVEHLAATPIGMTVRAEVELIEIEKRVLTFKVEAYAGDELIGRGTHKRCIILNDRFMEKTLAKLNK